MVELSVRAGAKEFGVSPQVMGRRLKDAGHKSGKGIKYTILQFHEALTKTEKISTAMAAAKLENLQQDAAKKDFENRQLERELVNLDEAFELLIKPFETPAKMIKDMPARLAVQCNPSDHDLSREVLEEYARELGQVIEDACTKLSK